MIIRKFKLYMVLAAASLAFSSCLDKYPENAIPSDEAVNTVDDVNQLVIGIYDSFTSSALYSGNLTLLPDIQTDLVYGVNGNTNVYGEIWRWNDILSTNTDIESVYGALYAVIGRCNFLLDHVEKVRAGVTDDDDLDRLDQYCGEAYFARALAYSELVKLFCKAYESDEDAAGQLGVVLNEHYDSQEPMVRATLKDSYQFILNDLDRAEELLQLEEDFDPSVDGALFDTVYFNEYTVYALRARIALYMKKWDEAVDYATRVIGDGRGGSQNYFLSSCTEAISSTQSYFDYMWTNDHGTEVIWKVSFTLNSYGGSLGTVFFNYDQTSVRPDYVPAQWVLGLYDANDLRASSYFAYYTTAYGLSWPLLQKYWGNTEFQSYNIYGLCMPKVFRLAEQYLIRAEAYAEQGNYAEASNDLSTLRRARYQTGGAVSVNADNWLEIVEQERVKELYMEGFRLQDLKRWHKGFEREPQDQSLENGSSLKVEADDPMFVWPIPQHEIEAPGSQIEPNESNR